MSSFGDGGPDRCSMSPKPLRESVFYSLKSPFLRGVERHVHGLQCRPGACEFLVGMVWMDHWDLRDISKVSIW